MKIADVTKDFIRYRLTHDWACSCAEAFFDLYIGDTPVSAVAKQEIGANLARILGKET